MDNLEICRMSALEVRDELFYQFSRYRHKRENVLLQMPARVEGEYSLLTYPSDPLHRRKGMSFS